MSGCSAEKGIRYYEQNYLKKVENICTGNFMLNDPKIEIPEMQQQMWKKQHFSLTAEPEITCGS